VLTVTITNPSSQQRFGRHPERNEGAPFDWGTDKRPASKRGPSSRKTLLWMTTRGWW
jgi:hypothetical protein